MGADFRFWCHQNVPQHLRELSGVCPATALRTEFVLETGTLRCHTLCPQSCPRQKTGRTTAFPSDFSRRTSRKNTRNDVSARDFPPCDCLIWSCVAVAVAVEVKNVRFLPAGRWEKKCVVECQIDAPFHTRVYPNPALHVAQCGRNRRKFLQSRFFGYLALAGIFLRNIISSTLRVVSQERVSLISRALSPETGWEEWTATTLL